MVDVRPGVVLVLRADSVSEELNVPMASLSELEVSLGQRSPSAGAGRGFLIGGGIGAGSAAAITLLAYEPPHGSCLFVCSRAEAAAAAAITFGLIGGIVGFVWGALSPGESWEEVPLADRVSVLPSGDGGVALGYSYSF